MFRISEIEKEFKSRGLNQVKDLASASLSTVCTMNVVEGDPLAKIYKAIEVTIFQHLNFKTIKMFFH